MKREAFGETKTIDPKREQSVDSQSSHGLQDYDVSDELVGDSKHKGDLDLADSKVPAISAKRGFLRALQNSCSNRCTYNSDCQNGYDGTCPYCLNNYCSTTPCGSSCQNNNQCSSGCPSCVNGYCSQNSNQNCGNPCNFDTGCQNSGGSCPYCVSNACSASRGYTCASQCQNDNQCYSAPGGCNYCTNGLCGTTRSYNPQPQSKDVCGYPCNLDTGCQQNSNGLCPYCMSNKCVANKNPGSGCQGDYGCSGQNHRCINGNCVQPQCGTTCSNNGDCTFAPNSCTNCISNQCSSTSGNRDFSTNTGSCVSDFNGLNSAAVGGNAITLCANSQITLTGSINVNTNSAFTLQCASVGSCTINGNGSYTIVINAANVAISGITFQNCKSPGNGGAITINAVSQGSRIQSCKFNSNSAAGIGGAVYVNGAAEVSNCGGSGNQAPQCTTIYQSTAGTCTALSY